jgi:siroheme synthase (precorrin-2 oxidase/ferrochelatase)
VTIRKRIEAHSEEELDSAVNTATAHCLKHGLDFYKILHGVDAYMERRKRRDARRAMIASVVDDRAADESECNDAMWGENHGQD